MSALLVLRPLPHSTELFAGRMIERQLRGDELLAVNVD
jgi:hypothetical protein